MADDDALMYSPECGTCLRSSLSFNPTNLIPPGPNVQMAFAQLYMHLAKSNEDDARFTQSASIGEHAIRGALSSQTQGWFRQEYVP